MIFTKTPKRIPAERKLNGCSRHEYVIEGDIVITPAGLVHEACWYEEGEFILFGIFPDAFARAIDESATLKEFELLPHFATPDPFCTATFSILYSSQDFVSVQPTQRRC